MQGRWRIVREDRFVTPLLILASLGMAAFYFFSTTALTPPGLPFDDAWIHLTLARNLVDTGAMGINAGQWSGGSSSLLWTALLAALRSLTGLSLEISLALGVFCQSLSAVFFYGLVRDSLGASPALLAGLLYATSGPLVFLGLSGMETALFLLLGTATLWCWSRGWTSAGGLLLALLILVRIEGLALWGLLLLYSLLTGGFRRAWRLLLPAPVAFLLAGLFRLQVEGQFLPLTLAGRRWLWGIAPGPLALWPAGWIAVEQFLRIWKCYLLDWLLQSFRLEALPGLMWIYWILWFIFLSGGVGWIGYISWRDRRNPRRLGTAGLLLWAVFHWGLYLIFAPIATLRHQVPVLPGLFLLCGAGPAAVDFCLRKCSLSFRQAFWLTTACGMFIWSGLVGAQWQKNYADQVRHINQLHVRLGQWVATSLPEDAVVAAFDIGALSYLGQREVVDLGGLTDPTFMPAVQSGQVIPYLRAHGVTHLAMVGYPGEYVWNALGLIPSVWGKEFQLRALQEFIVPPYVYPPFDRPAGYYYYPASLRLVIYEVEWLRPFRE